MAHTPWSRWILAPYSAILVILQLWTLPHSFISYRKFSFSLVCWHLQGKRIVDVKETVSIIYTGQILQDKFLSVCVQMAFIDRLLDLWYLLYHADILSKSLPKPGSPLVGIWVPSRSCQRVLTAILLTLETCPANTFLQETNPQMCGSNGKLEGILKCMIQVSWCALCLFEKIWLELLTRAPDTRKIKGMNLIKAWFYSIGETFLYFAKYYPSYGALYNVNIQCTISCSCLPYSWMLLEVRGSSCPFFISIT